MANLTSLDTNVLGQIACYLPETDQMALRKVSRACNRTLETEALWKKKCELMYPTSVKAAGVTWRDHFISCYIQNLSDIGYGRGVAFGGRIVHEIRFSGLAYSFSLAAINASMLYGLPYHDLIFMIYITNVCLSSLIIVLYVLSHDEPAATQRICEKICGTVMSNWVFFRTRR